MLLSLKHNFLFIHIAKTGGTSIRAALNRYRWRDPYRIPQSICSRLSSLTGHKIGAKLPRHAKAIAAMEMLPRDLFNQLFKFAFVRNPWDLQVSSYHHIQRERPHLITHIDNFESFINWKLDPERPYQYHADMSVVLQSDYLVDLHGNLITDFIGHYERLEEDFSEVCTRIGIQNKELPHVRRAANRKRDYRTYYSDDLAALVGAHYKPDIERFDYSF